jgi:hypothetical protein
MESKINIQIQMPLTFAIQHISAEHNRRQRTHMHHVLDSVKSKEESMNKRFFVELNQAQEKMLLQKANSYIDS